jgi:hypothetical protein
MANDLKADAKAAGAGAAGATGGAAVVAGTLYMMIMQFLSMILAVIQGVLGAIMAFIAAVVGIIAAFLAIFAGGGADPCAAAELNAGETGVIGGEAGGTVEQIAVAQRIWFLLASNGSMPDMSVAALLGNVENESGFRADAVNELDCKGLFQYCLGRADAMVAYAENNNSGNWQDVDFQVEYMAAENHKGVIELLKPADNGLNDVGAISDYWGRYWEIFSTDPDDPEFAERREASTRWEAKVADWRGGTGVGEAKLGDYDAAAAVSNALDAALSASDTGITQEDFKAKDAAGKCGRGAVNAQGNAKASELAVLLTDDHIRVGGNVDVTDSGASRIDEWPNYKKAHEIAIPGDTLWASCDRYVATVVRLSLDKNFPPGGTAGGMGVWMESNENWEKISNPAESKPGDVWVKSPCKGSLCTAASGDNGTGHIMMFVGTFNGTPNVIADASYYNRLPAIQFNSYAYYAPQSDIHVFRYKGKGEPVPSEFLK